MLCVVWVVYEGYQYFNLWLVFEQLAYGMFYTIFKRSIGQNGFTFGSLCKPKYLFL
jgi:hypothetical protein